MKNTSTPNKLPNCFTSGYRARYLIGVPISSDYEKIPLGISVGIWEAGDQPYLPVTGLKVKV